MCENFVNITITVLMFAIYDTNLAVKIVGWILSPQVTVIPPSQNDLPSEIFCPVLCFQLQMDKGR